MKRAEFEGSAHRLTRDVPRRRGGRVWLQQGPGAVPLSPWRRQRAEADGCQVPDPPAPRHRDAGRPGARHRLQRLPARCAHDAAAASDAAAACRSAPAWQLLFAVLDAFFAHLPGRLLRVLAASAGVFTPGPADRCVMSALSYIMTEPGADPASYSPLYASTNADKP